MESELNSYDFYYYIFESLYNGNLEFYGSYFDIRVNKEVDKPKLKKQYLKYFKYSLENINPVIQCGDFLGYIIEFERAELIALQLFDGTRTLQDIIFNEVSSNKPDKKLKIDDPTLNYHKTIKEFVENLYQTLIVRGLLE